MFILAISCLTTSYLPWFMDLTFQVPMQYCSLQHQTLLLSPVTSTAGYCFCFGSIPSFFLELFLHWSPVAYWTPTDLGSSSSVSYHFAFSYYSWGSQGKNTEVVCHSLFQGVFLIQGLNWGLLHCKKILYDLSHLGSPPKVGSLSSKAEGLASEAQLFIPVPGPRPSGGSTVSPEFGANKTLWRKSSFSVLKSSFIPLEKFLGTGV